MPTSERDLRVEIDASTQRAISAALLPRGLFPITLRSAVPFFLLPASHGQRPLLARVVSTRSLHPTSSYPLSPLPSYTYSSPSTSLPPHLCILVPSSFAPSSLASSASSLAPSSPFGRDHARRDHDASSRLPACPLHPSIARVVSLCKHIHPWSAADNLCNHRISPSSCPSRPPTLHPPHRVSPASRLTDHPNRPYYHPTCPKTL